ncbi:DUF4395 domain-containing protein [Protaetiibacter intestinalis]|uniref:DUF4395 domain-containing protein n=1 Tax=Protaetiibacter intestinalis TaxID=2419774 RepID=A0A387B340_9MICO|nr:DUF4395 domain-containing protein [Protaetiibacter intestinalis]AYF96823.1 DUF4395 domain-containing protein [Protaetiibacter intestinalis]
MSRPAQIDPRGARFTASVTAVLLLVTVALGLLGGTPAQLADRIVQPAFLLLVALAAIFVWSAAAGVARNPWSLLFRRLIRPRLAPPAELEDAAPPTFAQGVGALVTIVGVVLHLAGVPYGLVAAAAAAFVAAFLNGAFGYCLGCQLYLLLVRAGVIRKTAAA